MSTTPSQTLLLEIGCEELPDWMIRPALEHLDRAMDSLARKEKLGTPKPAPPGLGTPRRLAHRSQGWAPSQADRSVEVAGPRVKVAYDSEGNPTRALEGFARAQKVTLDEVFRVPSPKGEYVAARRHEKGKSTFEILRQALPDIVAGIPFGKTMRWGVGEVRFGRPVHWIVCLLGAEIVPFEFAGIVSGRTSRGVRFAGSPEIDIPRAEDYVQALARAQVVVDMGERKEKISRSLHEEVSRESPGHSLQEPPGLLETITGMVEHPVISSGSYHEEFLSLPGPILSTAMIHHQRFFPVRGPNGELAPRYLAVLNCDPKPSTVARIRQGNEWVLRARLRDAKFFWDEDRKRSLEDRIPDLEKILFETKLGSYGKKIERIEALVRFLADHLARRKVPLDLEAAARSARLAKCDLATLTVNEFPELQGVMGALAAREEGEPEAVWCALEQQYLGGGDEDQRPKFSSPEGAVLAIADRLDTLVGFFLIGKFPSGSRDPYGLRRAATAVVLASLDQSLSYSVIDLLRQSRELFQEQGISGPDESFARLSPFIEERLKHVCQRGFGFRYDAVSAALAVEAQDLVDAFHRAQALDGVRSHADFEALSRSCKRVRNILGDQEVGDVEADFLSSNEEKALWRALQEIESRSSPLLEERKYPEALREMASLRPTLDLFFDKVLVNDPDQQLKKNRFALLARVSSLLCRVGEISKMVLEGENSFSPIPAKNRS